MKAKNLCLFLVLLFCIGVAAAVKSERLIDHFDVHNANVHAVFLQLSKYSGIDIVAADNIKGEISLSVSNKSWRDILEIICRVQNLTATNEGSYIYVLPAEEFAKRNLDKISHFDGAEDASILKREVIKIFHIPVNEIKPAIESMLSAKGKITVVEHTNALIIYDTESNIAQIRKMISELDIETPQISISCKIIEVSAGAIQRMGVHWGYDNNNANKNLKASHISESSNFVTGALEKISYGVLSADKFNVALEYLFNDNKGEIIAQPQITTLDNKEANIFMGQQIPIKYLDEAGNTVVKMVNAGTALTVKPHLSGNGRILLELKPRKESYTLQDGTPVINQQSANTNVVVSNGETVVIAGLTSNESQKNESGIPVLKDIPLLGNLFKRSEKTHEKKDLIIFVTPVIIDSQIKTVEAVQDSSTLQFGDVLK